MPTMLATIRSLCAMRSSTFVEPMIFGLMSGEPDVLGARTFRSLALLERHVLPFAQLVETHAAARGVVEEVLVAVAGCNEAEALVAHEPLDGAGLIRHVGLSSNIRQA